jgi:hypothetical protein
VLRCEPRCRFPKKEHLIHPPEGAQARWEQRSPPIEMISSVSPRQPAGPLTTVLPRAPGGAIAARPSIARADQAVMRCPRPNSSETPDQRLGNALLGHPPRPVRSARSGPAQRVDRIEDVGTHLAQGTTFHLSSLARSGARSRPSAGKSDVRGLVGVTTWHDEQGVGVVVRQGAGFDGYTGALGHRGAHPWRAREKGASRAQQPRHSARPVGRIQTERSDDTLTGRAGA